MTKIREYSIPRLDPDLTYIDSSLWLPKSRIAARAMKSSLELDMGGDEPLRLWRDAPHHLGVPRKLIALKDAPTQVVDLRPRFKRANIKSLISLDHNDPTKSTQRDAFRDMVSAKGGILNLACGAGKTVLMLHAIAHWNTPTLVIAHQEEILHQWRDEILGSGDDPPKLKVQGLGWIQGDPTKWDWKQDIVFGMIRTLARHADSIPPEMRHYFGNVIWDEVHHLSAPMFCRTADVFTGNRFGATATVERGDGSEMAFLWHLGDVFHANLDQDLVPVITFMVSPTTINTKDSEVRRQCFDVSGHMHHIKTAAYVGQLPVELDFEERHLGTALDAGRKILALSSSVDHLRAIHARFPGSGLITQDVKGDARKSALVDNMLCFGTTKLASEALNDRPLDTLFLLTEFSKPGLLQQTTGRIQRIMEGKKNAHVVVIRHRLIQMMEAMARKMEKYFMEQGFRVRVRS